MSPAGRLLVFTDRRLCEGAGHQLSEVVAAAAEAGARTFVFREKDLPRDERRALAVTCLDAATECGASLIIASDATLAAELGELAVHVASGEPVPSAPSWGRSCHDRHEVANAARDGASYVTVSPVFASASKPGYGPALGREGLAELSMVAQPLPVLALGGVGPDNAASCLESGAAGVAVMSWVMAAADPATATAELVAALDRHLAGETSAVQHA
ncbi:MAG TPA: thiamine phosphate synthase [Candidatus Dormibacteraeota bacterium]|nr:thiamine phosphate synthase [Candidatus Dormibacteraeota bacterium]